MPATRSARLGSVLLVGLMVAMTLSGCVDNRENAMQFCDAQASLVAEGRDGEELSTEEASEIENDLESNMRDAEDSTRPVRRAARDLVDGYAQMADLLGDEDAEPDELDDAAEELQTARTDLREACAEFTDT